MLELIGGCFLGKAVGIRIFPPFRDLNCLQCKYDSLQKYKTQWRVNFYLDHAVSRALNLDCGC